MDWHTPLKSQQAEFIKRLSLGLENLLLCSVENQFSELAIIQEDALKHIRNSSWLMTERQKSTDSVREIFLRNLASKLGEEVVRRQLTDLIAKGVHKDFFRENGRNQFSARQWKYFITYIRAYQYLNQFLPVDLFPAGSIRLAANPSISIQVKACLNKRENPEAIAWSISQEDIERNVALACVLIQEEVSESRSEYHIVLGGFLPTCMISQTERPKSLGLKDLLYFGGFRSFLSHLQLSISSNNLLAQSSTPNPSLFEVSSDSYASISIGSWKYPLSLEQLQELETAVQKLLTHQTLVKQKPPSSEVKPTSTALKQNPALIPLWNSILNQLTPRSTQSLLRQQSYLLSFDGERAQVGISSEALFAVGPNWLAKVEQAFNRLLGRKIEVSVEVISGQYR